MYSVLVVGSVYTHRDVLSITLEVHAYLDMYSLMAKSATGIIGIGAIVDSQ